jgi:hypothetical protein
MAAALCGGAAVLALTFGGAGALHTNADPSPTVDPAPSTSPGPDDCCNAAQPQGNGTWDCKSGLNCGPINPSRPPPVTNPPRLAPSQQAEPQTPKQASEL